MPFKFPVFDHIHLENPPLREVICQVRFPPILRIGEKLPIDFQDRVRGRFPQFGTQQTVNIEGIEGLEGKPPIPNISSAVYKFINEQGTAEISLGVSFFALSTTKYAGWASFADGLRFAIQAVEETYQPSTATRVGLRYADYLNAQSTGITDFQDVVRMVRPELTKAFMMSDFPVSEGLARIVSEDGNQRLSIIFGIVNEEPLLRSFVLDFDLFTETPSPFNSENLTRVCDEFHATLYNAFRWGFPDNGSLQIFSPKGQ